MRILFALLIFLAGCATVPPCPPEDLYFMHYHSDGIPTPLYLNKGYFDDREVWKTVEEFEEILRQQQQYFGESWALEEE